MKTCTKCGIEKDETEYHKNKGHKDGLMAECKICKKKYRDINKDKITRRMIAYVHTWHGYASRRWSSINTRTINGSHPHWHDKRCARYLKKETRIEMTRAEFNNFCESHKDLIEDIYAAGQIPSIDRIDDKGHYSIDNIQIINLSENCRKAGLKYGYKIKQMKG